MECKLSCRSKSLNEGNGDLFGLKWFHDHLKIEKSNFPCCKGKSYRWDDTLQLVRVCPLARRKKYLDRLINQFKKTWGNYNPLTRPSMSNAIFFSNWLTNFKNSGVNYGYRFASPSQDSKPSLFWTLAAIAKWQYGMSSHIYTLGKSPINKLHPDYSKDEKNSNMIYFLEGVGELWKPEKNELVTTIIHWCEAANVPLWIEFKEQPKTVSTNQRPTSNVRAAFKQRLAQIKSRKSLDWLDKDVHSRINRICRSI